MRFKILNNQDISKKKKNAPKSSASFSKVTQHAKRSRCFPCRYLFIVLLKQCSRGWEPKGEGQHIQSCEDASMSYMATGGRTKPVSTDSWHQHAIVSKQNEPNWRLYFGCRMLTSCADGLGMQQFQQVFVGNETKWLLFFSFFFSLDTLFAKRTVM